MENAVCFIGHRTVADAPILRERIRRAAEEQIRQGADTFLFGDHSAFDRLCYGVVTELKEKYPDIRRIHFRCDYENTNEYTLGLLREGYEESVCPAGVGRAGKARYVERNRAMIRESGVCIFYYDEHYLPSRRKNSRRDLTDYQPKSGTALAYAYAKQAKKQIFNLFGGM